MVFLTVAMLALLLMVGLALDVGHATLNKSRLQNATDAAALAAAKMIDSTRSTILATTEALTAFGANANSSGDQELAAAYANGTGTVSVTVQYSTTVTVRSGCAEWTVRAGPRERLHAADLVRRARRNHTNDRERYGGGGPEPHGEQRVQHRAHDGLRRSDAGSAPESERTVGLYA